MANHYDTDGNLIAWTNDGSECENERCFVENDKGRRVHIIAAHTDPRAADVSLVLPTWHYESVEDALTALELGWEFSEFADTIPERDDAYARHVPVRLAHNGVWR